MRMELLPRFDYEHIPSLILRAVAGADFIGVSIVDLCIPIPAISRHSEQGPDATAANFTQPRPTAGSAFQRLSGG
ncbi:hypothetical protein [Nonomuraea sp. 10N515B]|uniref:hypothetical protein n=1 Tax=Nonomuraea sp. 10N515B TaxID=3457422 RepID=UPI003FCCC28A